MKRKLAILAACLPAILVADIITKRWAVTTLPGAPRPDFLGGHVPLTLAYNRGAAFGLSVGNDPRWFFIPVTLLALGLMVSLLVRTPGTDRVRILALALVVSGALGNLIDRVRWDRGVVDFIGPMDLPFTTWNWPIFNIADMAISCGAVLLAISFWLEERREKRTGAAPDQPSPASDQPRPAPDRPSPASAVPGS